MNSRRSVVDVPLVVIAHLLFGFVPSAEAQADDAISSDTGARWAFVDAIGYGGLGFGLGVAATWGNGSGSSPGPVTPPESALALIGVSSLAGSHFGPHGTALTLVGATTLSYAIGGLDFGSGASGTTRAVVGATTAAGTVAGALIGRSAQRAVAEGRGIDGLHRTAVIGGAVMAGGTLGALASVLLIYPSGEGTPLGSDEQTFTLLVVTGSTLGTLYVLRNRREIGSASVTLAPARGRDSGHGVQVLVRF